MSIRSASPTGTENSIQATISSEQINVQIFVPDYNVQVINFLIENWMNVFMMFMDIHVTFCQKWYAFTTNIVLGYSIYGRERGSNRDKYYVEFESTL